MIVCEGRYLAVAVVVAYLGVALSVQNLYPFSTFPMYAGGALTSGARLIAVDAQGEAREVTRFTAWSCPGLRPFTEASCADGAVGRPPAYLVKEATDYIAAHAGPPDPNHPVALVVRTWPIDSEGEVSHLDCPVHQCTALPW